MTSELRVSTIAAVGGTSAMTIDSSGRVLRPASTLVVFDATTVSGGNVTSGTIPFNTAAVNLGNHFNTSTYKFYMFNISFNLSSCLVKYKYPIRASNAVAYI